ncbi:MAG: FAD-dependent oxidoreductase [Comamonadaceae bacterium]|nr:FAD-dependent oxidoreductase [Comamonadaceae bacterium]
MTLFEAPTAIGGQFNLARAHPGQGGVRRDAALLRPPHRDQPASSCDSGDASTAAELAAGGFDHVVLATGIVPRTPDDPGHRASQGGELRRRASTAARRRGPTVAIVGAGGIGFDVAEFLTHAARRRETDTRAASQRRVGHRRRVRRAAAASSAAAGERPPRQVWLLQRKTEQGRATASPRPPAGSAARC